MKSFRRYIAEGKGGAEAGKMELIKTDEKKAYEHAKKLFDKKGFDIDKEIPKFSQNYKLAKKLARMGFAQRKDMPVIDNLSLIHI